jgi:hypothetical protein
MHAYILLMIYRKGTGDEAVGEPLLTNNPLPEGEVAPAAASSKLLQRGAKGKSGKMKRGIKSGPEDKMALDMLEKTLKVTEGNLEKHRETQGTNQEYKRKEEAFVYRIAELRRSIQAAKPPGTEQTPKLSTQGYSPGENRWSKVYDQENGPGSATYRDLKIFYKKT